MLRAAWKSLLARKLRLLMSAMAVVLGVAFVSGSLIFTDMLSGAFQGIVNGSIPDVQVQPKGTGDGFESASTVDIEPATVDEVARIPGVESAEGGVISSTAYLVGKNGKVLATNGPPSLGMNWTEGKAFGGQQGLVLDSGRRPTTWGEVAIDPGSLESSGYAIGDTMKIVTTGREATVSAKIVGTAHWGAQSSTAGATYAIFDTKTAQRLFLDGKDVFGSIWVVTDQKADQAAVTKAVAAALPVTLEAVRGDELAKTQNEQISEGTGFITTFLLVFAAIALVVGSFLIVNTFSILVAQRSRELALFRALGASRGQVRTSVLFEAFVVGLVGSTIGLLLGIGIARAIVAMFAYAGLDLGGASITLAPRTIGACYLIGMLVTMLAAYLPARRASAVPPVAAMTGGALTGAAGLGRRAALGTALAVAGLAALLAGILVESLPGRLPWIGAGALATLLGVALASPVLGRPVTWALGGLYSRAFGTVGRLAHLNAVRNPRRTAATASALMIGLALVTAMSIAGQSMKASTTDVVARDLRSDYIASSVTFSGFSTKVGDGMAAVPGVAQVHRMRYVPATVAGKPQYLTALDQAGYDKILAMRLQQGRAADWKPGTAVVGYRLAQDEGYTIGGTVEAKVNGQPYRVKVVGILTEDTRMQGIVTPLEGLAKYRLTPVDEMVAVTRTPSADPAAVRAGLDAVVKDLPMVALTDQAEFAEQQAAPINQLLAMVYGLLALAIVIAVLGIINTLALSVIERTREIGLLRAIGLGRGQLRRMIRLESVVIALLGSVLGLGMGLLFGIALQRALAQEGLNILSIPWVTLGVVLALALLVGVLAALYPASRAARLDVLRAIQTE